MSFQGRIFNFIYKVRGSGKLLPSLTSSGQGPANKPMDKGAKIVVVGLGLSALTFLEQLHQAGFRNIHVIAENSRFGGKCVHFGCIPSEAFWTEAKKMAQVVQQIAQLTEEKFHAWNFPLITASVKSVNGTHLKLSSGQSLDFDLLVLATGNYPSAPDNLHSTLAAENFWNLSAGQRLLIVSEGEPNALSYADMALAMGVSCTLVETRASAIHETPSFVHFRRQIRKRGLRDFTAVRITSTSSAEKKIGIRAEEAHHEIHYDELLYLGTPRLRLPEIDGSVPDIFAIDLENSRLKKRPDILVLGDAGGFLTAAEAELKALRLAWELGGQQQQMSLKDLSHLPLRLHAKESWAAVGHPLTFLASHWREVDFKNLGWSLIHQAEGKLWYLFNPGSLKIEALHICHSQASELISLAASLIKLPVTDPLWLTASVHPSAAEIFKVLALDLRRDYAELFRSTDYNKIILRLPVLADLRTRYAEFFTEKEFKTAQLESDPWQALAKIVLTKHLGENVGPFSYDSAGGTFSTQFSGRTYEVQKI